MKKGLIGASNNITLNAHKIKVWANSFKEHSDGQVILIAVNPTDEDISFCNNMGIMSYPVYVENPNLINNKRLKFTVECLEASDIDLFMVTDVFDVVFQADPFEKLDENHSLFVGSEGILVKEEPWNYDVIKRCFPDDLDACLNEEILCSGVMAGTRIALIELLKSMDSLCESSVPGHDIRDQAALIVLKARCLLNNLRVFSINDGWVVHCAVAGPTPFFEHWGFKNKLTERNYSIPKLLNDKIHKDNGDLYDIAHQFNRIPDWNEKLTTKYE